VPFSDLEQVRRHQGKPLVQPMAPEVVHG
jgi:hypothetical protein